MTVSDLISDLELLEGQSKRMNCPECGGRNTFTATRKQGKIVWNCYKASCNCSGSKTKKHSIDNIISILSNKVDKQTMECPFTLPDYFLDVLYAEHEDYLKRIHATNAEVMLDPRENRVVFLIRDPETQELKGAIGRAMKKDMLPKWRRYDRTNDLLYIIGNGTTAVIVEDCASACAVAGAGYTGIALLGTSLHDGHIRNLLGYQRVVVALDNDASKKSLKIQKKLDDYVSSEVVFLPDDLKYFLPHDIQAIIDRSR
jgi:hypothetical protein